jgi:type VI secretion system protein ImpM
MHSQAAAGFYGKLPCKGDFLQRRVSQEFVDVWDPWLQQALHLSRQQLQDRWLDVYLTSPVWRFALAAGVCGSGAYAGVMLPSVDRVGRYFPLTLVTQLSTEDCLLEVAGEAGRQWFEAAEALALGALQAHDLDLAVFDEQVTTLGAPSVEPAASESAHLRGLLQNSQFGQRPGHWQVPLASVTSLQRAANVFASRELERTLRPLALWWTDGSDLVAPCWLSSRGLPPASGFAAMLAGSWDGFGWESVGEALAPMEPAEFAPAAAVLEPEPSVEARHVEVTGQHAEITRRPGSVPRVYFVSRPELGIWGLTCSPEPDARNVVVAQAMADALHNLSAVGSLAALVEEVRRTLHAVRGQGARTTGDIGVVVFLTRPNECAVVYAGGAHAIRMRASEIVTIEGTSAVGGVGSTPSTPDMSLLDLLSSGPTPGPYPIEVHYDTVSSGDAWLLAGARVFDPRKLTANDTTLAAVQRLLDPISEFDADELPLMYVTAAYGAQ